MIAPPRAISHRASIRSFRMTALKIIVIIEKSARRREHEPGIGRVVPHQPLHHLGQEQDAAVEHGIGGEDDDAAGQEAPVAHQPKIDERFGVAKLPEEPPSKPIEVSPASTMMASEPNQSHSWPLSSTTSRAPQPQGEEADADVIDSQATAENRQPLAR